MTSPLESPNLRTPVLVSADERDHTIQVMHASARRLGASTSDLAEVLLFLGLLPELEEQRRPACVDCDRTFAVNRTYAYGRKPDEIHHYSGGRCRNCFDRYIRSQE